jgi:hypothetical protein
VVTLGDVIVDTAEPVGYWTAGVASFADRIAVRLRSVR